MCPSARHFSNFFLGSRNRSYFGSYKANTDASPELIAVGTGSSYSSYDENDF